jgi:TrpR-related protein YerC/YecD
MNDDKKQIEDLCDAILLIKTKEEAYNFLNDICTPQELKALSDRWKICQLLATRNFSYNQIHEITGASLATIGRVARFLKNEKYNGYLAILNKLQNLENENK